METAVRLDPNQTLKLIKVISPYMTRGHRLIEYLASNPKSPSGYVSHNCAIANISDCATTINKEIYKQGYFIGCERPPKKLPNKFGEPSNQFLWSIHKVA